MIKWGMITPQSSDLVEEFIHWAERDRNRSPNTILRYRATLRDLSAFATLPDATQDEVQLWWESRYDMSPGTRSNELACLRTYYKWCIKFDHVIRDPTRRLDAPKIPNRVPRMIGRSDFDKLLGELTKDAPDLRKVFAMGGYAGMRISECAALDWKDIDLEARRIFVRGKGLKERPVPLSPVLLDYLLPNTGGNVATGGGKPYTGAVLQRKVNRLLDKAGIDNTFHGLRKRGASVALSKGASPVAVKVMFGWSSMETVSNYAVVGDDELDRIAEMLT